MEDRLTKLEMLYSEQNQILDEMSAEMFQQQKEISALKQQVEELKEHLDSLSGEIGGQERPPHY